MTLGNHEFVNGMEGILPFLRKTTCLIVVSNLDAFSYSSPSTILDVGGKSVGVIVYTTPETVFTSSPPRELKFHDETEYVAKQVEKITNQGVDIIIVLEHSGYKKDKEIAEKVGSLTLLLELILIHSFSLKMIKKKILLQIKSKDPIQR